MDAYSEELGELKSTKDALEYMQDGCQQYHPFLKEITCALEGEIRRIEDRLEYCRWN